MPYVRISVAAHTNAGQVARLQRGATELMARLLGKNPELTVVSVSREEPACWSAGGEPIEGNLAQLEAIITEGSNTFEEKAAFLAAAHTLLVQVIGELAGPLYIVVNEVPARDWGYDGLSQMARRTLWQGREAA